MIPFQFRLDLVPRNSRLGIPAVFLQASIQFRRLGRGQGRLIPGFSDVFPEGLGQFDLLGQRQGLGGVEQRCIHAGSLGIPLHCGKPAGNSDQATDPAGVSSASRLPSQHSWQMSLNKGDRAGHACTSHCRMPPYAQRTGSTEWG